MKIIYVTFIFHGNMNYDRYTKKEIREKFPDIYKIVVQDFVKNPKLRGQIQLSGITIKSLQKTAPDLLEDLKKLSKKGQIVLTGTYYSEPVNVCIDGETDFECAWLGTEIVKREIMPPNGFFPQEQSYHPQLPWILTQLGLTWVTVFDQNICIFKPYKLKGLDGTKIVGVPSISYQRTEDLEALYDQAQDNSLYTFVGDFEKPPDLKRLVAKVDEMNRKGKKIEFITIQEYLDKFKLEEVKYYSPCSWTDQVENPAFARWVSDPQDIQVHRFTHEAMVAIKHARIVKAIMQAIYKENVDYELEKIKTRLIDDPSTHNIEKADEFQEVETKYLSHSGKITILSKAEHLLLWGVNSDARGWTPLIERRREKINSFINARILSEELIHQAMSKLAKRTKFIIEDVEAERAVLIFNPSSERKYDFKFFSSEPYEIRDFRRERLPVMHDFCAGEWITQTSVSLPAYGYTTIYLKHTISPNPNKQELLTGTKVQNDSLKLELDGENLIISKEDCKYRLALDPFGIREIIRGMPVHRYTPIQASHSVSQVMHSLYPQLRVYKQLDWGIHCSAWYTLRGKDILCEYEFDFTKPTFIGPSGNKIYGPIGWDPRGLIVSVNIGEIGDVYYDTPYATCKHSNSGLSFVTALRFATLQGSEKGVAIISQSGSQSFKCHGEKGEIGICLGSSTIGGPAEPAWCDVNPEQREIIHHERFEEEVFFGKYVHKFVLHPYKGDWREKNIPKLAQWQTEKVYIYNVPTIPKSDCVEPAEQSFLNLFPYNLELTNAFVNEKGEIKVRFYETHGLQTQAELRIGEKIYHKNVSPNEITTINLE